MFSPSGLHALLVCPHLFALEQQRRQRGEARPARSAEAELVALKGEAHEKAQLNLFRSEGLSIVEIDVSGTWDWARAAADTAEAMRGAAEVIYQGVFVDGAWHGIADFLVRVEAPSAFGPWSYEAWDTKLARRSRPYFLLQLCFYSVQIARLQGLEPTLMHVVLGDGQWTRTGSRTLWPTRAASGAVWKRLLAIRQRRIRTRCHTAICVTTRMRARRHGSVTIICRW